MPASPEPIAALKLPASAGRWVVGSSVQFCAQGAALLLVSVAVGAAWADGIYSCTNAQGRRLTSDRPILDCIGKDQQILNKDGSVRGVLPPTLTADERQAKEAQDRLAAETRMAQQDAARRDRNLMARYPSEAAHQRARESALDTVRLAMKTTELRLRDLTQLRKPLQTEAEFYQGKTLPPKLRNAMESIEASVEAQKASASGQEAELGRINKLYDIELDRLRRLWAGAAPGTLGNNASDGSVTVPTTAAAAPASAVPVGAKPGR
jgi:hypothetical protein